MKKMVNASSIFLWTTPEPHEVKELLMKQERKETFYHLTDEAALALYEDRLVDSELLYGEIVEVLANEGSYTQVVVPDQKNSEEPKGYPGWVFSDDLSTLPENWAAALDKVAIKKATAEVTFSSETQKKQCVSIGTILSVVGSDEATYQVITPDGTGTVIKESAQLLGTVIEEPAEQIIARAKKFLDLRYVWAGTSAAGFDCSGFVYSLYRTLGIWLSRDAEDQASEGMEVAYRDAQPGDLLFFAYEAGKGRVHHVGLYLGKDQMIHSQTPGSKVLVTTLSGTNYETELCTVRRLI
ncbi:C40 family peptidase [Carnobacterium mobile]|uniref:C40 family peptidase n=1 Tax=Carnobacterium mobile TaxID=2750 RepID=UPI0018677794|nr:NlpC/P60 family protein [Carnobacterium mobile]